MEELDFNLLEAYHRVRDVLARDNARRGRRIERVMRKELRRPVRAWCVGIRASDSRWGGADMASNEDWRGDRKGYAHRLRLSGARIGELCRPVRLPWPGLSVADAARVYGRDTRTIYQWVKAGILESRFDMPLGKRTRMTRWVWSPRAIDPAADSGSAVWGVWGTLWQGLWERVPEEMEMMVERVPRVRPSYRVDRPGERFVGWDWRCPGRVLADGSVHPCGRVCKKLWLPLPVWTIGQARGKDDLEGWREAPTWDASRCRLACADCWGIRYDNFEKHPAEAWNRFVSAISGGLLYGREVTIPASMSAACDAAANPTGSDRHCE